MIQYVVPPVALRMKPLLLRPTEPPWPQPTKLSSPGAPVNTSMLITPLLGLGSKANGSLVAGVNEYHTLCVLPKQRDESVKGSNVACEMSTASWNGRLTITVALLMSSFDGDAAVAGGAVATSSGTMNPSMATSRYPMPTRNLDLIVHRPLNRYELTTSRCLLRSLDQNPGRACELSATRQLRFSSGPPGLPSLRARSVDEGAHPGTRPAHAGSRPTIPTRH